MNPFQYIVRMTPKTVTWLIAGTWIVSILKTGLSLTVRLVLLRHASLVIVDHFALLLPILILNTIVLLNISLWSSFQVHHCFRHHPNVQPEDCGRKLSGREKKIHGESFESEPAISCSRMGGQLWKRAPNPASPQFSCSTSPSPGRKAWRKWLCGKKGSPSWSRRESGRPGHWQGWEWSSKVWINRRKRRCKGKRDGD